MAEETQRVSELPIAADAEITESAWVILNTALQQTKRTLFTNLIRLLFADVKEAKLTITSADVLTLNGTPIQVVAKTGLGTEIEVISASYRMVYNTTPYATNINIRLITDTASVPQAQASNTLDGTITRTVEFRKGITPSAAQSQIIEDKALMVDVKTGNPTGGDSDIVVDVLYRIRKI